MKSEPKRNVVRKIVNSKPNTQKLLGEVDMKVSTKFSFKIR
jgi:hypothetical protein